MHFPKNIPHFILRWHHLTYQCAFFHWSQTNNHQCQIVWLLFLPISNRLFNSPYQNMAKALGEKYPLVYLEGTLEHLQQVLSMQPCENIFHIQVLVMYSFCNPTNKTETGTANTWGTTNSKPHGPIIMMGQSETLSSS